jgi:hypothetical protein
MPEYLFPGVYVEEVPLHAEPIDGVHSNTIGLKGARLYRAIEVDPDDADIDRNCVDCDELPAVLLAETRKILSVFDAGTGIVVLLSSAGTDHRTAFIAGLVRELPLDLYRVDLSTVVSKYIGETEKNLRRLFDAAEQHCAILFFDEADALFGKRSEVKDSHDRYASIDIGHLLDLMRKFDGLVILATDTQSVADELEARGIPVIHHGTGRVRD